MQGYNIWWVSGSSLHLFLVLYHVGSSEFILGLVFHYLLRLPLVECRGEVVLFSYWHYSITLSEVEKVEERMRKGREER